MTSWIKIWLVWSINERGLTSLRAICTERLRAVKYRKLLLGEHGIVRCWIEQSRGNHLFGDLGFENSYAYRENPRQAKDW